MEVKKKIALFFPYFIRGGSDVVVAQAIEALKETYDISLITTDRYEKLRMLNEFCGTQMLPKDITIINPPFSALLRKVPGLGLLKYHWLVRYFKWSGKQFDLLFGMYKEIDFGRKALQYIHVPELDKHDEKASGSSITYYQNSFFGDWYKRLCYFISGFQKNRMQQNSTIVDSQWAKNMTQKTLGIDSMVVYPPVTSLFPLVPFEEKEHSFVYLGRITPAKEIEKLIRIIARVREKNPSIRLHIGGAFDHLHMDYGMAIKDTCDQNGGWCFFDGQINQKEKPAFLARYRYGISGCVNEAFGIAVVEMVKAGAVVFVPQGGGQVEIVNHGELTYTDEADAVEKIHAVLNDMQRQKELRDHLENQGKHFSLDQFRRELSEVIKEFLANHGRKTV